MATIAAVTELQPTDRRRSQSARNDQGRDTSPTGDVLMEQILENMNTTPQEEALTRITSVPGIRRDKVLDIRRQIAAGTYDVADRLDGVVERVLQATSSARERQPPDAPRRCGQGAVPVSQVYPGLPRIGTRAAGDSGVLGGVLSVSRTRFARRNS